MVAPRAMPFVKLRSLTGVKKYRGAQDLNETVQLMLRILGTGDDIEFVRVSRTAATFGSAKCLTNPQRS